MVVHEIGGPSDSLAWFRVELRFCMKKRKIGFRENLVRYKMGHLSIGKKSFEKVLAKLPPSSDGLNSHVNGIILTCKMAE